MSKNLSVREACKERVPLDGADAQALEHALTITERERDNALDEIVQLKSELERIQRWPRISWAQAKTKFLQQAAKIARSGVDAKPLVATLDDLGMYVNDLEAEIEQLKNKAS